MIISLLLGFLKTLTICASRDKAQQCAGAPPMAAVTPPREGWSVVRSSSGQREMAPKIFISFCSKMGRIPQKLIGFGRVFDVKPCVLDRDGGVLDPMYCIIAAIGKSRL